MELYSLKRFSLKMLETLNALLKMIRTMSPSLLNLSSKVGAGSFCWLRKTKEGSTLGTVLKQEEAWRRGAGGRGQRVGMGQTEK